MARILGVCQYTMASPMAGMFTHFQRFAHPSHADLDQLLPHEAALMHHIVYVSQRVSGAWRGLCSLCYPRPWHCTITHSRSGWDPPLRVNLEQPTKLSMVPQLSSCMQYKPVHLLIRISDLREAGAIRRQTLSLVTLQGAAVISLQS